MILQGGLVISDIVFGCHDLTYNPSLVQELSLLTQVSSITTLQSFVSEKKCKALFQRSLTDSHGLAYEEWQPHT